MDTHRFTGRTAVVTGAGSGIGRATALRLAAEGATVVVVDRSARRLEALVADEPRLPLFPVLADLTDEDAAGRVLAATEGRLDVLVNNGGIMDRFESVAEVDDATWDRVFAVNVGSVMRLTRAAIPLLRVSGRGAVVNVTSEASLRGSAAGAAYTASQHALAGLTKSTALMHAADGIRTNAVAPGATDTGDRAPMGSDLFPGRMAGFLQNIPYTAAPEQVAAVIVFLASDDASNVNGVIMPSDGGWSAV
ncbi:SDR family NAD(P)-dependent oxidoreductase [Kocuria nitroreducens]|uniref:SDR family NAD(P)-dependent oxidoreductase n=1 Tax=Kocuria nitroreducens TaxID=3058914 RepID=UPI0036D8DBAE